MAAGPIKTVSHHKITREDIAMGMSYETLVQAFEQELGHWDEELETKLVQEHAPWSKVTESYQAKAGPSNLMIFFKIDQGRVTSLEGHVKKCALYLVGNPLVAEPILEKDIKASLYVPFRICLYDNGNPGGAMIGYDLPSSFLRTLNNPAIWPYGHLLDSRIDNLVQTLRNKYR